MLISLQKCKELKFEFGSRFWVWFKTQTQQDPNEIVCFQFKKKLSLFIILNQFDYLFDFDIEQELKEENHILSETRTFMEKQLEEYQQRLLSAQRMESELNKHKQAIDDLSSQSEMDKRRMCELCERNAKLELELKSLLNQNVNLDEQLTHYKQKYTFASAELIRLQQAVNGASKAASAQQAQLAERQRLRAAESEEEVCNVSK